MKKFLPAILLLITNVSIGQTVQWASKVFEVSSQLTPVQYGASQALGKPNVFPAGGQNPNAWTPDKPKKSEFIKLGFATPMQIRQIAIAESYNPSAIRRVYVYDTKGFQHLINTLNPQTVPLQSRMLNIFMDKTPYKVSAVKLEFEGNVLPDYFSIDAVAISDSNYPVTINVNTPEHVTKGFILEHLDKNVNTEYNDYNAIISPDGKRLYFSRQNHPDNVGGIKDQEDIWYCDLGPDGKWLPAKNAGAPLNNADPNFINSIAPASQDGKEVLLILGNQYDKNSKTFSGASVSNNVGGTWTQPKDLRIKNDYNYSDRAHYFLASSQKALLMSIARKDTKAGNDLYVSLKQYDSTWSEPLNLGKTINTVGDEFTPFMAADNKTLYFSSNGFSGFGGSDIYVSKRLDDTWTKWSEPQNLGPEVNSKLDELFFNIPSTGEYAYFSRAVTPNNFDIYRAKHSSFENTAPISVVMGKLVDGETGQPVNAKITYERLKDKKEAGVTYSDPKTGEYAINLPGGEKYGFKAETKNHITETQELDLTEYKKPSIITKDVKLTPIAGSKKVDNTPKQPSAIASVKPNQKVPVAENKNVDNVQKQSNTIEELKPIQKTPIAGSKKGDNTLKQPSAIANVKPNQKVPVARDKNVDSTQNAKPVQTATTEKNETDELRTIYFKFGSSALKKGSYSKLNKVVRVMKNQETAHLEVAGHTDETGSEEYNLRLSERRAKTTAKYLIGKGVAKKRITTVFFGETKPIVPHAKTKAGHAKNRRVEFKTY